ncbi:MAG: TlpA family protein disulfide reductase [Gemmatimonadetes bacterium]|nr:TlpA family protein disulfide reductase [Gemmatimonadota bacterium]MBK9548328.1 TlpA family protein disulfide reductase [Gemmatimonadota bacterium]MBL0180236.1 TlpA family protein disulfide reductase [Gemmatimonadota bacterium]
MPRFTQCSWLGLLLLGAAPGMLPAQAPVGTRAPVVEVTDLDGTLVKLPAGRPALIEFWATWCEVCEQLFPRVVAAKKAYGDRVDFYGVNVTVNESKSRVKRWVTEHAPPFRVLYDERGLAVRAYGAPATSYVVIVDAKGVVRYTGSGGTQALSAELAKVVAP